MLNSINTIIQGDCVDLLRKLPDSCVDMTFADPPFNLKKGYNSYKDSLKFQEYLDWCSIWISEMVRITKPTGSIFVHNIPKWLIYYANLLNKSSHFKHWIAWDAPSSPMGKSLQPSHYGILFYTKQEKGSKLYELRYPHKRDRKTGFLQKDYGGKKDLLHPYGPLVSDVWTDIHRIKHNSKRDPHPCQLPVHLLDRLILMTTDEGDTVLDPFSGTGTTAISAKRLGRNYIGFELDSKYVDISKEKLSNTLPDFKIGNSCVSFYLNDVITIRDKDWIEIKEYFDIPSPIRAIDQKKISLKHLADMPLTKKRKVNDAQLTVRM
ncbi:MAG: site-specific DNA-methyltransferase [Candidatus Cloacimonetes bacterium]|jgi:site-specific DNA-methyltransferase (adenine-specific)|nr:site-specific DNA-methyltransferase [Candidatus Cloacimonadota bacterium]MDY0173195.1 site-specific DNA-methyltransferase [Candidatus Cloacimonadaceae bacterium]